MDTKYLLVRLAMIFWKVSTMFLKNAIKMTKAVINIEISSALVSIVKNSSIAVILPATSFQCSVSVKETGKDRATANVFMCHLYRNIEPITRETATLHCCV